MNPRINLLTGSRKTLANWFLEILTKPLPSRPFAVIAVVAFSAVAVLSLSDNLPVAKANIGNVPLQGYMTDQTMEQVITDAKQSYQLSIVYPDKSIKQFSLPEIGVEVDTPSTIDVLRQKQLQAGNLLAWWKPLNSQFVITAQPGAVDRFIAEQATVVTKPATNASLQLENGTVQISPSVAGEQYSLPGGANTVMAAVANLDPQPLALEKLPLTADIAETDLAKPKVDIENILNQPFTITVGSEVAQPTPAEIASWLVLNGDRSAIAGVNQEAVQAYLANLAKSYTRTQTNQVISAIDSSVLKKGQNGVTVTSTQVASDTIAANLIAADGLEVTLPTNITPYRTVVAPTSGKWIEININTKRMYVHDNGEIIRTFLITAGATKTPTITGHFKIYHKNPLQDMRGFELDGTPYFQADVPYAMFFRGNYGIHGAYWQPDANFGVVNASHGCVRMRVWEAAWLFDWAPIGTPVVVHR